MEEVGSCFRDVYQTVNGRILDVSGGVMRIFQMKALKVGDGANDGAEVVVTQAPGAVTQTHLESGQRRRVRNKSGLQVAQERWILSHCGGSPFSSRMVADRPRVADAKHLQGPIPDSIDELPNGIRHAIWFGVLG